MLKHIIVLQSPKGRCIWLTSEVYGINRAYFFTVKGGSKFTVKKVKDDIPKNLLKKGYGSSLSDEVKLKLLSVTLDYIANNPEKWLSNLFSSDVPAKMVLESPFNGSQVVYLSEKHGDHVLFKHRNKVWEEDFSGDGYELLWKLDFSKENYPPLKFKRYYEVYGEYADKIYLDAKLSVS